MFRQKEKAASWYGNSFFVLADGNKSYLFQFGQRFFNTRIRSFNFGKAIGK